MRARFLLLWTLAVFATALSFVVHLTVRFENVRLGYSLSKARAEQEQLIGQRRLLALESATLRQVDRVETVARGAFGMDVAPALRVIAVDNVMTARISGRAQ
jgi:cell division protein FtsL